MVDDKDIPDEDGITWRMRDALHEVFAGYGDNPLLAAERAYLAMRAVDPAILEIADAAPGARIEQPKPSSAADEGIIEVDHTRLDPGLAASV
jgi:hypothetical protein